MTTLQSRSRRTLAALALALGAAGLLSLEACDDDRGVSRTDTTAAPDTTTDAPVDANADAARNDVPDGETRDGASPDTTTHGDTTADPLDTTTPVDPSTNVIPDWDFEVWQDGLPVGWFGPETNLTSDAVRDDTMAPFSQAHACGLANPSATHKRFATAPLSLVAGRYRCAFQVRGAGELRGGFFAQGNYHYDSYTIVDSAGWQELRYELNLAEDASDFALVLSLRNTVEPQHLSVDYVVCNRLPEPCDAVACDPWAVCDPQTVTCTARPGQCIDTTDCPAWRECSAEHVCTLSAGRCERTADCDVAGATPVCDTDAHTCVAGDPCAGVICDAWKECNPADALCILSAGRCDTTMDCVGGMPACDTAAHVCVGADDPVNIFPNGGFEQWSDWDIPYFGVHRLPDAWYGLFEDLSDATGASELDPAYLLQYTANPHSGSSALQVVQTVTLNADRFASEDFDIPPGSYTCAYWVRGKGSIRHRGYSTGGWQPLTDFVDLDTDAWTRIAFEVPSNVRFYRLLFYVSNTDPARDHVQIDDVVCTAN